MAAKTQSKQESLAIQVDNAKSSNEKPKPQQNSCGNTSRVEIRNGKIKMKQNPKKTNTAKALNKKEDDNEKGHVDNLISWLTSPLEVDVDGDQRNERITKVNNSRRTTSNKNIQQRNKTGNRTVKTRPQQRKSVDPPGDDSEIKKHAGEQFLNWLTTAPDLGPNHPHNKQLKKQQQQLASTSSNGKLPKNQQDQNQKAQHRQQVQQQQRRKLNNPKSSLGKQHQKKLNNEKMKEFGKISPANNKLLTESYLQSLSNQNLSIPDLEVDLDPHPDLPSHVPTPETIDDIIIIDRRGSNNESLAHKVEGVFDRAFNFIFDDEEMINNLSKSSEVLHNPAVIKYAPSFETPPQSPVSSKKPISLKSKLLQTPPEESKTRWGPEVWKAKKSSPDNSLSIIDIESASIFETNNASSNIDTMTSEGKIKFELSELANQEKLLREAMDRKQKKDATIMKVNPPTRTKNVDGALKRENSSRNQSAVSKNTKQAPPKSSKGNTNNKNSNNNPKQQTTKATTLSSQTLSSPSSSPTSKKTNSLQLRWMYQNALNIQAACNSRRGSMRFYDGEYDQDSLVNNNDSGKGLVRKNSLSAIAV